MRSHYLREPAFVDSLHLSAVITNQCYERSVKYAYRIIYSPQAPNKGRVIKLRLGPQFLKYLCYGSIHDISSHSSTDFGKHLTKKNKKEKSNSLYFVFKCINTKNVINI